MNSLSILDLVNRQQHAHYRMISKFENGVQGAFTIQDDTGKEFVLKWADKPELTARIGEALRYTELLHSQGYPLPRYVHIGSALNGRYSVQEKLPGSLCDPKELPKLLPRILELNELQRGKAVPGGSWPEPIVQAVLQGGTEFCRHEPLLQHSSATAELLDLLKRTASAYEQYEYAANDIVHFDFHHQNLLVQEGELSGVVDWQFPLAGDRTFDLLTLMLYTEPDSEVWNRLWEVSRQRIGRGTASIYLSYLLLRQANWCIDHWPAWLDHWYKVAKKVLT
ncbi:aminoglycoside phosphotransferase family protein [Paenibacillus kobensis]|uniref:aminoglycoside phosphotransferase family protein n=1 Tax=Paenibacillus kobensis TaxID=59841 RepID=UPI000FD75EE8|nr:aminoglycoside phosphotransferase family protein [Paenibacillus kobensis]